MPDRGRHETLARQWQLLRLLSSHSAGKTAAELRDLLETKEFPTTKRTVERDLKLLETVFPIDCNDKGVPHGWRWMPGKDSGIPGMELDEALSLTLARDFLEQMLPRSLWRGFIPRLQYAGEKLRALAGRNRAARWADKVRYVTPTLPFVPPKIDETVLDRVQEALLKDRQLEVAYGRPGDKGSARLTLHPLGIIQRGPVAYLVATAFDYEDVRYFALHRVRKAEMLMDSARRPPGFSLDDHLATGAAHFTTDTPVRSIRLRARVNSELAAILEETALSPDQKLSPTGSADDILVTATLPDTWQLRWWILSQGARIEVLAPKSLRRYVADEVAELSKTYRKTGTRKS